MSLYESAVGINPMRGHILYFVYSGAPIEFDRLRDAYPVHREGELQLCVYTRTGGHNRDDHAENWAEIRAHPLYIADEDDDFDNTFAHIYFHAPADIGADLKELLEYLPAMLRTPKEKFQGLLKAMEAGETHRPHGEPPDEVTLAKAQKVLDRLTAWVQLNAQPRESQN